MLEYWANKRNIPKNSIIPLFHFSTIPAINCLEAS